MATADSYRLNGKVRDSYLECVLDVPLIAIASNGHLAAAQGGMDRLLARGKLDRGEEAYLDALSDLGGASEDQHFPIKPALDADMLRVWTCVRCVTDFANSIPGFSWQLRANLSRFPASIHAARDRQGICGWDLSRAIAIASLENESCYG